MIQISKLDDLLKRIDEKIQGIKQGTEKEPKELISPKP